MVDKLDREILLAHVLQVSRSFLYAYPEKKLTLEQEILFKELIERREAGEPIPYLTNHQEFWSLDFKVTKDTLIPRPETELLVETILEIFSHEKKCIADLGTGSGCIALSIAYERPEWMIHATDKSAKALEVAKYNAENLKIKNCHFHLGKWLKALPSIKFDAILSNPPYIAKSDTHLKDLIFEPKEALVSGANGLDDIQIIITSSKNYLAANGLLLVEHGYNQADAVRSLLLQAGYHSVSSKRDLAGMERVTIGRLG